VTTTFGVIRGETVHHESDDLVPVTQYLGVPYGVAPLDQYRFNMAISAAKWTHMPKDAIRFGAACVQSGLPDMTSANSRDTMSAQRFDHIQRLIQRGALLSNAAEDCLYMNIFVPERIGKSCTSLLFHRSLAISH
jgi:carboxylesterase type B